DGRYSACAARGCQPEEELPREQAGVAGRAKMDSAARRKSFRRRVDSAGALWSKFACRHMAAAARIAARSGDRFPGPVAIGARRARGASERISWIRQIGCTRTARIAFLHAP